MTFVCSALESSACTRKEVFKEKETYNVRWFHLALAKLKPVNEPCWNRSNRN